MQNKILIVPDVHGRLFWREALDLVDTVDQVVFLGDYLDPYPHEEIEFDDAVNNFVDILDFKEKYPDKVTLLLGNHDCHYMFTDFMDCSRLNRKRREEMNKLFSEYKDLFKIIFKYDNYLFSHAGVVPEWLDNYCYCSVEEFMEKPLDDVYLNLEVVSYIRGGWEDYGSCVWSDVREFSNNLDYFQIFGHTQLQEKAVIKDNFACLDCRKMFILDTITKEIKEYE